MLRSLAAFLFLAGITMQFFAAAARGDDETPPIFDKRSYADAKKAAETDHKWFIAKATAVWCGPCKQMDRTTWRDEKVVAWLQKNAIVVAFDVDKDAALAKKLSIQAMPTMIAFKDGNEFDRIVGYKSGDEFLVWLEGIAKGEKSIEAVKMRAGDRGADGGKVDVDARYDLARSLAESGKFDEAAGEYVWLWQHMLEHDGSMYGVRLSFMAKQMERVAAQSKNSKAAFVALRDATGKRIEGDPIDPEDVSDWIVLNRIVADEKATLAWFDKVKDQPRYKSLLTRSSYQLVELLLKEDRWADLGRLYTNPLATLEQDVRMRSMIAKQQVPNDLPDETRKMIEDSPNRMFREKMSRIYAGLLAAARDAEATKFVIEVRKADTSAPMTEALIAIALRAKQPRREHIEWIDKTDNAPATLSDLKPKVQAALDAVPPPERK